MVIKIPGRGETDIRNIVFDFNGTLALDGKLLSHLREDMSKAKELYNLFVITADTYGTVKEECKNLGIQVSTIKGIDEAEEKREFIRKLGSEHTASIGNGMNDIKMFQESALSVAIMGSEGCAAKLLTVSDIAVKDIKDAIDLFLNPKRIIATLRY